MIRASDVHACKVPRNTRRDGGMRTSQHDYAIAIRIGGGCSRKRDKDETVNFGENKDKRTYSVDRRIVLGLQQSQYAKFPRKEWLRASYCSDKFVYENSGP